MALFGTAENCLICVSASFVRTLGEHDKLASFETEELPTTGLSSCDCDTDDDLPIGTGRRTIGRGFARRTPRLSEADLLLSMVLELPDTGTDPTSGEEELTDSSP